MRYLIDRLILLGCCGSFMLYLHTETNDTVIVLLLAVTMASLGCILPGRTLNSLPGLLWLAGSLLYPPMLFCLPLAVYEILFTGKTPVFIGGGVLLLLNLLSSDSVLFWVLPLVFSLFAAFLLYRSERIAFLETELKHAKDNRRELEFLMAERQRRQTEHQDNEIHLATLKERNRIAREIHDNVGHLLSRSILMLGALKTINRDEDFNEPLEDLSGTLNGAMESIRTSVHNLHDESIDLDQCIREVVRAYTFCPVILDYDMSSSVMREVKYCFLAIIKEALSNTAKHSNATSISIVLREHATLFQLLIQDNGTCAAPAYGQNESSQAPGIGLHNMKDRVRTLKGTIHFNRDNGFRIFITIPKQ